MIALDAVTTSQYSNAILWPGGPMEVVVNITGTATVTVHDCLDGADNSSSSSYSAITEDLVFTTSGRVGRFIGGPVYLSVQAAITSGNVTVELRPLTQVQGEKVTDVAVS